MSYTEIYGFDKKGIAYEAGEIQNSWRGGMAVWLILEEKYLPQYKPVHESPIRCFKPSRCTTFDNNVMKEIWDLVNNEKVTRTDRIVLATTFDFCVIRKSELLEVIKAFNDFEGKTSLKEQAAVLDRLYKDDNCIAVGWNQTSVNGDTWTNYGYDEELEESIPYNLNENNKHWFLFDDLQV